MLHRLTSCCYLVYVFHATVCVTHMLLSLPYLYIYFVRYDNMLTVGLRCDITKPLLVIGQYFGCLVFVTVFRFTRSITSDNTYFKKKKRCGVLCVCFDSHVLLFYISESLQIWSKNNWVDKI